VSTALASFAFRLFVSYDHAVRRIVSFRPHVAVGFGNFGSVAPLLAAKSRGIPVVIHEANAVPGKANLLLSRFSDRVLVNFPRTARHFVRGNGNLKAVGMPVREEFIGERNRLGALAKLNLSGTDFTLLVAGGSQGAQALNKEFCRLLPNLQRMSDRIQVIHLTGRSDYLWVRACYDQSALRSYVVPFETRMKLLYDAADLMVSRAGASTIAEIIQTGKPAVLVPFPHATDGHQTQNAECLKEKGGAVVLKQTSSRTGQASVPGLFEEIAGLIANGRRLREMSENSRRLVNGCAASKIADVLFEVTHPHAAVFHDVRQRVAVPA
jgi:UDP-N-acetylglucosamine--N-acetylmuramyl-(pentapeptide) pyrophosphoryl-undecaprenol N-acetylglucosamine transferase